MAEHEELWPEGVFELIWHQHNSDDWMAEVRDTRTNESCQVCSIEELERFIQAHLRIAESPSLEPKK